MSSWRRSVGGRNAGLVALRTGGGWFFGKSLQQCGAVLVHWLWGDLRWQEYPEMFSGDMMMEIFGGRAAFMLIPSGLSGVKRS